MEIDFDELIYQITLRFDASITPAEARALSGTTEEKRDINWLIECLSDCAIDNEKIERIQDIDFERFRGVGVIFVADRTLIFSFDELRQQVYFNQIGGDLSGTDIEIVPMLKIYDDQVVYRFYEREKEDVAVIPGIESHWFYAPLWKNRKFLLQAGLASLLTNVFAVGTSLFALIVYNRIIPANAMASLYVLVIGMVILLSADYLIKTVRSRLLGIAGMESDIVIADRLFGQIIDMRHDTKKGSVGTLASILKE